MRSWLDTTPGSVYPVGVRYGSARDLARMRRLGESNADAVHTIRARAETGHGPGSRRIHYRTLRLRRGIVSIAARPWGCTMDTRPPVFVTDSRAVMIIPAGDPLFVDTLRAALESFVVGDYRRAANYFQDAAAVAGYRPEASAWATLGAQLQASLDANELTSRDASYTAEAAVRR